MGEVDVEKVAQVRALAKTLHRIVPAGRMLMANEMYDLGARMHPELATKELVSDVPADMRKALGNWAPQSMQKITAPKPAGVELDPQYLIGLLRKSGDAELVAVADTVEAALDDPVKKAAALADFRKRYPDAVATATQLYAKEFE